MISTLRDAVRRVRRTAAQRGLRNAVGNIVQRIRSGNFSTAPGYRLTFEQTHPFDEAIGLDTGGFIHGSKLQVGHPHDIYSVSYFGTAPSVVQGALDRWRRTPGTGAIEDYTFIDFGAGKGRAVLIASQLQFRRCIGVELNQGLSEIAVLNMKRWQETGRAASPMQMICQDATEFEFPRTPCLVYLYNPFTAKVLEQLLEGLAAAFAGRPGDVDVLYVNPEFKYLLAQHPGFTELWEEPIHMSPEDSAADCRHLVEGSGPRPEGELLHEVCSMWRWTDAPAVA